MRSTSSYSGAVYLNVLTPRVKDTTYLLNLTSQDYLNNPQTTEVWALVAGSNMMPAPISRDLLKGYLSESVAQSNQYNFFCTPGAHTNIIYYAEQNKQPFTVGEILALMVCQQRPLSPDQCW